MRRAGPVIAALAVALSACAGPTGEDRTGSSAPPSPAGVHVELRQDRFSWGARVVQLHVTADGADPVAVRRATFSAPGLDGVADSGPVTKDVPVGSYRDVDVPLGEPACEPGDGAGDASAPDAAAARVVLTVDVDGRPATLELTPTDPNHHLARIHAEDCAAAAFASGASAAFSGWRTERRGADLVALVDLTVTPVPGGPVVAVDRVDQTILVQPLAPAGSATSAWTFPALAPVSGPTTVTLEARPGRCDPHAVAEDKRGTFLGLRTSVAGVAQHVFYVQLPEPDRGLVKDYVGDACGWG